MAGETVETRTRWSFENGKWFCETQVWRLDTQTLDRAWVREVEPAMVPEAVKWGIPKDYKPGELLPDHRGT